MTALHQRVRRTIRRQGLCPPGTRVLIAVSGGSDSVALTHLLLDLAPTNGFTVASLAHFNHRLRGTAGRDEEFCRNLAARVGLPIAVAGADVAAYARDEQLSVEEAARRARYAFLHRAAADAACEAIAVGHTRDDQAETFLLKLARGAGLIGLAGVFPRRGLVIRPLLDAGRGELRAWLHAGGLSWVEDETNAALAHARNRVRHRVIPELDLAYGGPTSPSIARAAALAREDGQWLDEQGAARFNALAAACPDGLALDAAGLVEEPLPLRRRVLLAALRRLAGDREVGLDHVEAALDVLAGEAAAADVPGGRVELRRGKLVLQMSGADGRAGPVAK